MELNSSGHGFIKIITAILFTSIHVTDKYSGIAKRRWRERHGFRR